MHLHLSYAFAPLFFFSFSFLSLRQFVTSLSFAYVVLICFTLSRTSFFLSLLPLLHTDSHTSLTLSYTHTHFRTHPHSHTISHSLTLSVTYTHTHSVNTRTRTRTHTYLVNVTRGLACRVIIHLLFGVVISNHFSWVFETHVLKLFREF